MTRVRSLLLAVIDGVLAVPLVTFTPLVGIGLWIMGHARARPAGPPRMLILVSSTWEKELQRGFLGRIQRTDFGYFEHVWHLYSFAGTSAERRIDARHTAVEFAAAPVARLKRWGCVWSSRILYGWALSAAAVGLIRRRRIAVIDAADAFLTGAQAWWFSRLAGIPYTIEIHRAYQEDYAAFRRPIFGVFRWVWLERALGRWVIQRAARVIVDRAYYWEAAKQLGAVPEQAIRTRLVADPVFYDASEPAADVRRQLELPAQPLVLFVGRLSDEKFPGDVVRAAALIGAAAPDAVVVLAGDGPMRDNLERLARECGVASRVRWLGTVAHPTLRHLMTEAAAMLCPNTGLAMLEAALCGCPLVAYDSDWHPEVIASAQEGVLVRHRDHQALGEAVCELLRQPERAKQMAAQLRDRLVREHAPERFQQDMRECFEALLGMAPATHVAAAELSPVNA